MITCSAVLCNSVKLWAMPGGATQDGWVLFSLFLYLIISGIYSLDASVTSFVVRHLICSPKIHPLYISQRQGREKCQNGATWESRALLLTEDSGFWTYSHNAMQPRSSNNEREVWCIMGNTSMSLGVLPPPSSYPFLFLNNIYYLLLAVLGLSCGMLCTVRLGLSCPVAYDILVPWPGMKPRSSALEGRFLTTGSPGKSPTLSSQPPSCSSQSLMIIALDLLGKAKQEGDLHADCSLILTPTSLFQLSKGVPPECSYHPISLCINWWKLNQRDVHIFEAWESESWQRGLSKCCKRT